MPRSPVENPHQLPTLRPVREYPCDRCGEYEATRWGRAQVVEGEKGLRWRDVGLCDRCAAVCSGPSPISSGLGAVHTTQG